MRIAFLILLLACSAHGQALYESLLLLNAPSGGASFPSGYYLRLTNNISGSDGDLLSTWTDVSGNGNDATQTGSLRPFLTNAVFGSLSGVQFDGANKMTTASITHGIGTGDFTWAVKVIMLDASGTFRGAMANGTFAPAVFLRLSSTTTWGCHINGVEKDSANTLSANTKYWLVVRRSGGTISFWQNGTQTANTFSDSTSVASGVFAVGDDGSGGFGKQIQGEVICWASALTDGQITSNFTTP